MEKGKTMPRKTPLTKVLNGKRVPVCDYWGECKNKAHKEVYPCLLGGNPKKSGWSYLCKKHFKQEIKKFKGKLPFCSI